MPSSPKIPKEVILQNALEMLIESGYSSINIKALAKRIGCSTQPISWHFGNMDKFREELTKYALEYANKKMTPPDEGMNAFTDVGYAYVDLAFDEPNLFKYLYMTGESGYEGGGMEFLTEEEDNAGIIEGIARETGRSKDEIKMAFMNTLVYTHGLACFVASGLIKTTKEEVRAMMKTAGEQLFKF